MKCHYFLNLNLSPIIILFILCLGVSCSNNTEKNQMREKTNSISTIRALSHLEEKIFQSQIEGENTDLYWIYNDSMAVAITNYGGRIVGLWVPDQNGDWTDVVVGMGSVEDYINSTEAYFGATIGRSEEHTSELQSRGHLV